MDATSICKHWQINKSTAATDEVLVSSQPLGRYSTNATAVESHESHIYRIRHMDHQTYCKMNTNEKQSISWDACC
jgi:hypothetical protein